MSRFVEVQNNLFAKAGITLRQARMLELLFIEISPMTYWDLAVELETSIQTVGRLVNTLRKKGLVLRYIDQGNEEDPIPCQDWEVEVTEAAYALRDSFAAWSDWICEQQERKHPPKLQAIQS